MIASVDHRNRLEVSQIPPAYAHRLLKNPATETQKAIDLSVAAAPFSCSTT